MQEQLSLFPEVADKPSKKREAFAWFHEYTQPTPIQDSFLAPTDSDMERMYGPDPQCVHCRGWGCWPWAKEHVCEGCGCIHCEKHGCIRQGRHYCLKCKPHAISIYHKRDMQYWRTHNVSVPDGFWKKIQRIYPDEEWE